MAANMPPARVWRPIFLELLAQTGNVTMSATEAGVHRRTAYRARASSKKFAADWDEAVEEAIDLLEAEARRRAFSGVDKPIFHAGTKIETVKEYSDTLLIFLLKAHRPDKFRDNLKVDARLSAGDGPPPVFQLVPVDRQEHTEESPDGDGDA